jgi:3',5'-cyclic AMP phosphodiesterase CpdA
MSYHHNRRQFLQLMGLGGVVFASRLTGCGSDSDYQIPSDFFFIQLSDTHIGYSGPANPNPDTPLPMVIASINSMPTQPDFIIFTGDLTHTTDDPSVRQARMSQFRQIVSQLKAPTIHFMPGEHDAAADSGLVYQQNFGMLYYSFDYKGVHFVALDNASDPKGQLGSTQIDWLRKDLAPLNASQPIVVFAHRPLFMLYPQWEWDTPDGQTAIDLLMGYRNVSVFYGHIHQQNTFMTGNIIHRSERSLMFPLPAPGATQTPTAMPIAWDPQHPYAGLGYRDVQADSTGHGYNVSEVPLVEG